MSQLCWDKDDICRDNWLCTSHSEAIVVWRNWIQEERIASLFFQLWWRRRKRKVQSSWCDSNHQSSSGWVSCLLRGLVMIDSLSTINVESYQNQVKEKGYALFANKTVITVFSASRYQEDLWNYGGIVNISKNLEVSFTLVSAYSENRTPRQNKMIRVMAKETFVAAQTIRVPRSHEEERRCHRWLFWPSLQP